MRWPGFAAAASPAETLNSIVIAGMKPLISSCWTTSTLRAASTEITSPVSG